MELEWWWDRGTYTLYKLSREPAYMEEASTRASSEAGTRQGDSTKADTALKSRILADTQGRSLLTSLRAGTLPPVLPCPDEREREGGYWSCLHTSASRDPLLPLQTCTPYLWGHREGMAAASSLLALPASLCPSL